MQNRKRSEIQYLFKVSLKRRRSVWRLLVLRGDQTLEDLHEVIFTAFERYDDHLYSFYFPTASARRSAVGKWPKNIRLRKDSNLASLLELITDTMRPARDSMSSSSRLVKLLSTFSTSVTSGGTKLKWKRLARVNPLESIHKSSRREDSHRRSIPRAMSETRSRGG